MGVKVRFWKGAWWIFVSHDRRRKAKRIGDRETALRIAKGIREKLARRELQLPLASGAQTLQTYSEGWLKTVKGTLKASTVSAYSGHRISCRSSTPVRR